jgi:hypothetical protein
MKQTGVYKHNPLQYMTLMLTSQITSFRLQNAQNSPNALSSFFSFFSISSPHPEVLPLFVDNTAHPAICWKIMSHKSSSRETVHQCLPSPTSFQLHCEIQNTVPPQKDGVPHQQCSLLSALQHQEKPRVLISANER